VWATGLANAPALAQNVPTFGGFKHESDQPIEIVSDALEVRQDDQIAVFQGNVEARQGEMMLKTETLEVAYDPEASGDGPGPIRELLAKGGVFITNGEATASGQTARYSVVDATIVLDGEKVTLTQDSNVIQGKKLVIDLNTGSGKVEGGRVRTIFQPGSAQNQ
jgi:lipopolysaccharide export system protein LptA